MESSDNDLKSPSIESQPTVPLFIERWLKKAESAVGAITILLGIAGFGVGLLFGNYVTGLVGAFITFGIVGALEVHHIQTKVRLLQRLKERNDRNALFNGIRKTRGSLPKIISEFEHDGVCFRSVGLEDVPLPLTMAGPLCPKCNGVLAQRSTVQFPGIIRITFLCRCGFAKPSSLTRAELIAEAEQIANLPK